MSSADRIGDAGCAEREPPITFAAPRTSPTPPLAVDQWSAGNMAKGWHECAKLRRKWRSQAPSVWGRNGLPAVTHPAPSIAASGGDGLLPASAIIVWQQRAIWQLSQMTAIFSERSTAS
jgi:hypothetical protein